MNQATSFVLLMGLVVIGKAQEGNLRCAQNGEYCLTHNDCCSRSCLSFSYKCVPVPPSASTGTTLVPVQPSTIDTENRFGGSDDNGGASLTQKTCALNGEYCLTHAECCSGSCLSFSYKCVPVSQPGSTVAVSRIPTAQTATTVDFANRVGEEGSGATSAVITSPPPTLVTTPKKCAQVGEYCLTPNDCCSGSCLSFSYKCVTNYELKGPVSSQQSASEGSSFVNRFGGSSVVTNGVKCSEVGEYCLTSSECCSKSCLSFAYKCVNRYDLGTSNGQISQSIPISTTNRFGDSSAAGAGNINRQCTSNGLYCSHNKECCSGACFKSVCSTEIKIGVPESELTQQSAANGPYVQVNGLDDLIMRFGGQMRATEQPQNRQLEIHNCKPIGDICARHEECCSKNCHSYKRKCVN